MDDAMNPMKCVAVFGGSGKTGQEVVSIALKKGLRVKALYRPGSEPRSVPPRLEIIKGRLTANEDVRRTMDGTTGAILVFGPRLGRRAKPDVFCEAATKTIIAEMKNLGVDRIICQTGAMAGGGSPNWSWMVSSFVRRYRKRFPTVDKDRDAQEIAVKESALDWTLAKPFRISGAKGKGAVRAAPEIRISAFTSVRRTDLAEFLVREFIDGRFHHQAVYIVT